MPNFALNNQPQYPIVTLDTSVPITKEQLIDCFSREQSITLCVRSASGHENRGGYFFCLSSTNGYTQYNLETIEGVLIDSFDIDTSLKFINHVAGLLFDKQILMYCQNSVNFRND